MRYSVSLQVVIFAPSYTFLEAGNMDEEPIEEEDKASSWKSWTKFRKNAVQMAQVLLGGGKKPLQEWEKEMFLFPKACRVCRLAELDMYDCHKCQVRPLN